MKDKIKLFMVLTISLVSVALFSVTAAIASGLISYWCADQLTHYTWEYLMSFPIYKFGITACECVMAIFGGMAAWELVAKPLGRRILNWRW